MVRSKAILGIKQQKKKRMFLTFRQCAAHHYIFKVVGGHRVRMY